MRENARKYYYSLQQEEIERIKESGKKPSLLMHTCCAMCACWPIVYLSEYFDLILYYYNDNIYPEAEYHKRLGELQRYVREFNEEFGRDVRIITTPYQGDEYRRQFLPYASSPEGGERCLHCFDLRMGSGIEYAEQHGYDYFCTVMTISRQKNSVVLNQIGERLQKQHPSVKYFFSDFKKDGGLEKADQLIRQHDIYRQNYCGCFYSYNEMLERARKDYREDLKND
ncbi:MAG: epoxyqueuosine reductase QueH [Erysipelotrichaceae bacterium]|nr:epoxyqueuosine reductase QueH [Erysipelotrichaceae bacterium]